ncbi:MaoC/PaaZ C-terminal domain-containing protein [Prescottella equi]|uniref:MaoC/PaaZ C-terminal domain-containing protein n=1 Tax=Rhodococcus hoagii TaxID=43767 RepID=UPI00131DB59E|nr:MaoC/PaaZ C-terminal domain-containing protein [Prescottella equi]MCD7052787.1 MaoC family dehydratase N-terminal domain-containing protein [Rhodococcus sp. BH2-1]
MTGTEFDVEAILAQRVTQEGRGPVDAPSIALWCAAAEDANPRHWASVDRPIAPPAMASTWTQSPPWTPSGPPARAMELHHRLKEEVGLPTAVVREVSHRYGVPVRVGDRLTATHRIVEVGPIRPSRMGEGRDWSVEVDHRNQHGEPVALETWAFHGYRLAGPSSSGAAGTGRPGGALQPVAGTGITLPELSIDIDASRIVKAAAASGDWTRFHHDPVTAAAAGLPDIILNTPGHMALVTRWITDCVAPGARLRQLALRLRRSVVPGDVLRIGGEVVDESVTADGWRQLGLVFTERVGDKTAATGRATVVAAASSGAADPWDIPLDRWQTFGDTDDHAADNQ